MVSAHSPGGSERESFLVGSNGLTGCSSRVCVSADLDLDPG